jgi:hypothetical protein
VFNVIVNSFVEQTGPQGMRRNAWEPFMEAFFEHLE